MGYLEIQESGPQLDELGAAWPCRDVRYFFLIGTHFTTPPLTTLRLPRIALLVSLALRASKRVTFFLPTLG